MSPPLTHRGMGHVDKRTYTGAKKKTIKEKEKKRLYSSILGQRLSPQLSKTSLCHWSLLKVH